MGAAAGFDFDTKKFRASMALLAERISEAARAATWIAGNTAMLNAKKTTLFKNRTGALRKSIQGNGVKETRDGFSSKIRAGVGVKYARAVHDGSRPHMIVGNPFLTFRWKGVLCHFRYVNHPGTKPRPFITVAGDFGYSMLEHESKTRTAKAIEDFNRGG